MGTTLAGLASTSASASLSSFLAGTVGAAVTSLPAILYMESMIGIGTAAISATLGFIGINKAASISRREPSSILPSDAWKNKITYEFGSLERYNSELKSAWKWIGSSYAVNLMAGIFLMI